LGIPLGGRYQYSNKTENLIGGRYQYSNKTENLIVGVDTNIAIKQKI
jgi:hypothetical protein